MMEALIKLGEEVGNERDHQDHGQGQRDCDPQ